MSKPIALTLDFTCFCLITIQASCHCHATIYFRGKKDKVYKPYATGRFDSSGLAIRWAKSIEPSIACVKVAEHERQ